MIGKTGLKDSTEALIMEQTLNTRANEARIYHTRQDPRCRLCKDAPETVQYITAGCKMPPQLLSINASLVTS